MQQDLNDRIGADAETRSAVAGLSAGAIVMSLDGEIPVEHLAAGDKIITRDSGIAILRGLRRTEVRVAPVCIKAGSLGHTRPGRDMVIGPDTRIHIRDWRARALFGTDVATVKAKRLVDGEFVALGAPCKMVVHELEFERSHIIYADGLEIACS